MEKSDKQPGIHHLVSLGVISLVCALVYANTLSAPFVFDDFPNIVDNPHIRVRDPGFRELYAAATRSPNTRRPVAHLTFAVNYFFSEYGVLGYHLVNIVIHLTNGILVYALAALLVRRLQKLRSLDPPAPGAHAPEYKFLPLLSAVIFVAHPIQTQSVTYIVQRMNSLATMFYLASLLLYLLGRIDQDRRKRTALLLSSAGAWVLALGTKEIAATLPLAAFLCEWYFIRDLDRDWLRSNLKYAVCLGLVFMFAVFLYLDGLVINAVLDSYVKRDFSPGQRVLTEMRVVVTYLSLLLLPHPSRLNLLHHVSTSQSLINPITTLVSLGLLLGCAGYAVARARRQRLVSFCVFWFLIHLAVESSVIGLELMFEHRLYLPMVGFSLMSSYILLRAMSQWPILLAVVCTLIAVSLGAAAYVRNGVWQDRETLWSDVIAKNPFSHRARYNLGSDLLERGDYDAAMEQFLKTLEIKPDHAGAHNNLGLAHRQRGDLEAAARHHQASLRIAPNLAEAHYNLGLIAQEGGHLDDAARHYSAALRIHPGFDEAHNNLGAILAKQGSSEQACHHYRQALHLDPSNAEARNNLGLSLERLGKLREAVEHYLAALELKPDYTEAYVNLGAALAGQGNTSEAIRAYMMALQVDPGNAGAHNNLGAALMQQGRPDQAIGHYREALRIEPAYSEAHNNLGIALFHRKMVEDALGHLQEAIRIDPENEDARRNLELVLRAMEEPGR